MGIPRRAANALRDLTDHLPHRVKRAVLWGGDMLLLAVFLPLTVVADGLGGAWDAGLVGAVLAYGISLLFITERVVGIDRLVIRRMRGRVLRCFLIGGALYAFLFVVGLYGIMRMWGEEGAFPFPSYTVLAFPPLLFSAMALQRFMMKWLLGQTPVVRRGSRRRLLIYGAGQAGQRLAVGLVDGVYGTVVGFIDDSRDIQGRLVAGWPVYAPDDLGAIILREGITDILVAIPSASFQRRAEILESLRKYRVRVRLLPGLEELTSGVVGLGDVREPSVNDLLGREPAAPDPLLLQADVKGSVVLVTGAGGSIGSELCRQIVGQRPKVLVLLEANEYALYNVLQDLAGGRTCTDDGVEVVPLLGTVLDEARINAIFRIWRPHVIYHAAAYKHVPLVEQNVVEGIRNNVWGTWICARAAQEHAARKFVLISTDKAVRPTNVMGASKRLAELILQALAREQDEGGCCFTMVRFGNVLGSSGSVVPLFQRQIRERGTITVTHPEVTRYFMTVSEAAQLVIQAGAMAKGGEVFLLDMGEPVKVLDLAKRMVELAGLTIRDESNPHGDVPIEIIGLRPGEKLQEELLVDGDPLETAHPKIFKARETGLSLQELREQLKELERALNSADIPAVLNLLRAIVQDYTPADEIVDLCWNAVKSYRRDIGLDTCEPEVSGEAWAEPYEASEEVRNRMV